MALNRRQTSGPLAYTDVCTIYRKNPAKNSNGQVTWSVVASDVACRHYTRNNADEPFGNIVQHKQKGLITDNYLRMDPAQDIRTEDIILFTYCPNAGLQNWWKVAGDPLIRATFVANCAQMYILQSAPLDSGVIV